ncbi:hypothetical protein GCM10027036_03730 [Flavihumibacter cheonanensis]|uniref:SDR family NAD(P)-dependent oxidoreductase n=2 Tax=Flavihumibacter TaxID=1004301 RepID=UPI001EF7D5A0|nr:SDR family NAD(P)-dependent oxidoreductase [Flavihumibacter cheonanensis]MCG7752182.1 SDR family NAD(P)-dependent oxidoreductase [Flavihumibacter cheonanensis]
MQKTIFITGASAGLGKANARLFQSKGWKVIATMRNPEKETELTKLDNVSVLPLDITDVAQISSTVDKALALGDVDVVFNNAGYALSGALEALSDDKIVRQIDTNLLGAIRVTQAFIPYFRQRKAGLFITTTSIGGIYTFPLSSLYHATKWALEGWSESMSFELAAFNIGIKTIAPGGIITDFMDRSLDALRGFYGTIGGTKNGFSWNAFGTYKGAQDYRNKYDGYVFNSKFYNKNFGGMAGYSGNWGYSRLTVSNFDQHIGMTEGDRDSATGQFVKVLPGGNEGIADDNDFKRISMEIPYQRIRHFKIASTNKFRMGSHSVDLVLGYQHNQRQEFGDIDAPSTPGLWFNLQTVNYALSWHLPQTKNFKTTIGVNGMYQTNQNKAAEVLIPDYNLFDIGGFVFTQYTKNKLTVSGGIRYDTRHDDGKSMEVGGTEKFSSFTRNFSNISGSAGLSYEVSKNLALKANIARGFRAPNFAELASNGAHEGTNRYEIGDNSLKSEVSLQGDAGMELTTEHVALDASVFYNRINNFIFYERVPNSTGGDSTITDPESGDELNLYRFAQQTASLYGAELSLDIHPHPLDWLHFKNTFSYTRGKFAQALDGSDNIPFVPAARLITSLGGDFLHKGNVVRNLHVGIESDYNFAQNNAFTGYNTETATPSYWLVGVNVTADFVSKGRTLFTLSVTGNNLGDIAYQNHLSRFKYLAVNNVTGRQGVFAMGRNFGFKINVPLNFNW